jgi:hypothetical protein
MSVSPSLPFPYPIRAAEPTRAANVGAAAPRSTSLFAFACFLLLTAIVFLRPAEILPELEGLPIYECVMVVCLLSGFGAIIRQLRRRALAAHPWTLCVIALLPAIMLADLSQANLYGARTNGLDFAKVLLYYLLLLGHVNSLGRLRTFLVAVAFFVTLLAGLALLQYHGLIDVPNLEAMVENPGAINPDTGESAAVIRIMATGVFHDPNDFSLILGAVIMLSLYWVLEQPQWVLRSLWLCAVAVLTYAFILTQSRGGFLGLMAGGSVLLVSRFGWRRGLRAGVVLLPLVLLVFAGRQLSLDISDTNDTGQARIQLWRDSLYLFRAAPIFGIGVGQLAEANDLVAHNSYVHAFTELGVVGGTLFVGSWYVLIAALRRHRSEPVAADLPAAAWRPYIFGMAVTYGAGLYSLTRCYALPTYLVLGIGGAYAGMLSSNRSIGARVSFNRQLCVRVALAGLGSIVFLHLFVALFAQ